MAEGDVNPLSLVLQYWPLLLIFSALIIIVLLIITRKKKGEYDQPFKPQILKKTLHDDLSDKLDTVGIKSDATLLIGFNRVARICKYLLAQGKFETAKFNWKEIRIMAEVGKPIPYNLFIAQTHNNFFLWRWMGIKKNYFFLDIINDEGENLMFYDDMGKRFIFRESMDLISYGKVWINGDKPLEYLTNISWKRMMEQTQMHLENWPDKLAHLEAVQSKKERLERRLTELEKGKWEERKRAGDSDIEA